jgi:hypothetical protein
MIFLTKEAKISIVTGIEIALMRRGNANFNLVLSKLKNALTHCEFHLVQRPGTRDII